MDVTLYRAFDMTKDPFAALEDAIQLGCRTILTSGQAKSAAEGKELLRRIFFQAAGRIDIMAGCGVKSFILFLFDEHRKWMLAPHENHRKFAFIVIRN